MCVMSSLPVTVLLWAAALSSGLMAGVYFAFSGFIMKAFDELETAQSVTAMNAINEIILRSLFMPVFFVSSIISLLLIVIAFVYWDEAGAGLALIAGMVYFVGMFVCTVVFNVPLNNTLSRLDPTSDNAQQAWTHYLNNWTMWNHLRTLSSLLSCVLCIWLLTNH
jgi:uncharacterized membrane protein